MPHDTSYVKCIRWSWHWEETTLVFRDLLISGAVAFVVISACEQHSTTPPESYQAEKKIFDTQDIRIALDEYKTDPSPELRCRVESAFEAFDQELRELEVQASLETGETRQATEEWIADLKARREIHWARAQATPEEMIPTRVAEPVILRAEPVNGYFKDSLRAQVSARTRGSAGNGSSASR